MNTPATRINIIASVPEIILNIYNVAMTKAESILTALSGEPIFFFITFDCVSSINNARLDLFEG